MSNTLNAIMQSPDYELTCNKTHCRCIEKKDGHHHYEISCFTKKQLPKDKVEKILELYKDGKTVREIQDILGIKSPSNIHYYISRAGAKRKGNHTKAEYNALIEKNYHLEQEVKQLRKKLQTIHKTITTTL